MDLSVYGVMSVFVMTTMKSPFFSSLRSFRVLFFQGDFRLPVSYMHIIGFVVVISNFTTPNIVFTISQQPY